MKVGPTETSETRGTAGGATDPSRDDAPGILGDRRRRFALHYLERRRGGPVPVRELSDRVASWEYAKPVDELDAPERERVGNALRQFHLPEMEDRGFVEVDARGDSVRLTETAAARAFRGDAPPAREVPWSAYYLGLATVGAVTLVGAWLGVPPLAALSPLLLCAFLAVAVAAVALAHCYEDVRDRLGARESPPAHRR